MNAQAIGIAATKVLVFTLTAGGAVAAVYSYLDASVAVAAVLCLASALAVELTLERL